MGNFYEILGVPKSASAAEIRAAYTKLAKEKHPDRFPDPQEKQKAQSFFQDLTAAFNTLYNERTRGEYDAQDAKPKLETPEELARDAYERALKVIGEHGSFEDAVMLLRAAVHHRPEEARYQGALGRILARRPAFAREAIQALERATQLSPGTASYHADLASLFLGQGMKIRAQKAAEHALKLAPHDPAVQKLAAQVNQP